MDSQLSPPGQHQERQTLAEVSRYMERSLLVIMILYRVFYRGCDYKLEVFKEKYDLFYTVRSVLPAWFADWSPRLEEVRAALEAGVILPVRGYDKRGRVVIIVRQSRADPAILDVDTVYKTFLMVFTLIMEANSQAYLRGYVIISDQADVSLRHGMMMTPGLIKKHMVVFQDSYPMDNQILINSSNLFIVNMPSLLQKFLNMFTAALDEKYRNILRPLSFSEAEKTLLEEVGEEILPKEYGGTNGTVEDLVDFWREEVPKHEDFLQRQTLYKTDESLRDGEPKTAGNLFGSCSIM